MAFLLRCQYQHTWIHELTAHKFWIRIIQQNDTFADFIFFVIFGDPCKLKKYYIEMDISHQMYCVRLFFCNSFYAIHYIRVHPNWVGDQNCELKYCTYSRSMPMYMFSDTREFPTDVCYKSMRRKCVASTSMLVIWVAVIHTWFLYQHKTKTVFKDLLWTPSISSRKTIF